MLMKHIDNASRFRSMISTLSKLNLQFAKVLACWESAQRRARKEHEAKSHLFLPPLTVDSKYIQWSRGGSRPL